MVFNGCSYFPQPANKSLNFRGIEFPIYQSLEFSACWLKKARCLRLLPKLIHFRFWNIQFAQEPASAYKSCVDRLLKNGFWWITVANGNMHTIFVYVH